MFKKLFEGASLLDLPPVVMLAFIALFAAALIWTFSRHRKTTYDRMSALPLMDEEYDDE